MTEKETVYVVVGEGWWNEDTGKFEYQFFPMMEPENFQDVDHRDYKLFIAERFGNYEQARDKADELEINQDGEE